VGLTLLISGLLGTLCMVLWVGHILWELYFLINFFTNLSYINLLLFDLRLRIDLTLFVIIIRGLLLMVGMWPFGNMFGFWTNHLLWFNKFFLYILLKFKVVDAWNGFSWSILTLLYHMPTFQHIHNMVISHVDDHIVWTTNDYSILNIKSTRSYL